MQYKQFISRLFSYLKSYIGKLILISLVMIFAGILEGSIPEITGQIVDKLFTPERDSNQVIFYSFVLFSVIALSTIFTAVASSASSWVSNKVIADLRIDMFTKLLKLPKSYFDKRSTGQILSKITFDVEQVAAASSKIWLDFIKSSILVTILIAYLFYKNWQLSLILLVILPLIFMAIKLSSLRMRSSSKKVQNSMGSMTHLLNENISAISVIKIYNAQKQESNKFINLVTNIRQQRFKIDVASAFNIAFVNILIALSLAIIVYFAAILLNMSAGEFLSFFTAISMLIKPTKILININKPMQQAVVAGESIFGLIDESKEVNNANLKLEKLQTTIKFENVCFAYSKKTPILKNINLTINTGETIALVGSTGSGKTTITQLLTRFYLPDSGRITINDIDINNFEISSLRSKIAFVDQKTYLFNDTVKNNIALGKTNKMSDEQIENVAKIACSYQFIEKLNAKFDTKIGEDGVKLSGGQRQRLAIARAIAKDSPILILDEATSALDFATEKQIQQSIDKIRNGKTIIIVAHRLSTIKNVDRIIVLSAGRIIEQGKHQELLDNNSEYAKLYKYQLKTTADI